MQQPARTAHPTDDAPSPESVQRFDTHVPEPELDDLRSRLAAARLPEPETVV